MTLPVWAVNAIRCLGVVPGERVAVLVDEPLIDAGLRVCDAATAAGARVSMTVLPDSTRPIAAPDAPFVTSLSEVDAVLFWIGSTEPSEFGAIATRSTSGRRHSGTRIAFGAEIDEDILTHEMSADYDAVQALSAAIVERLEGREYVRVTTPAGTDCTFDLSGRSWLIDDGRVDRPRRVRQPARRRGLHRTDSIRRGGYLRDRLLDRGPRARHPPAADQAHVRGRPHRRRRRRRGGRPGAGGHRRGRRGSGHRRRARHRHERPGSADRLDHHRREGPRARPTSRSATTRGTTAETTRPRSTSTASWPMRASGSTER